MTHPNDDRLLEFVLQALEETDSSEVRAHLLKCEQCRDLRRKLQSQVERLGRIDMQIDIPEPSRLPGTQSQFGAVWRWAAVLAAGFLLGFLTAQLSDNAHPIPVPQRLIPAQAPTSSSGYVSCQALDLRTLHKW
jgi:hypothetical protein